MRIVASPMSTSPHDALFKSAFGQPDIARSELELLLPPEVRAHLDLATLEVVPGSFVDDELRHAHTDLLYTVRTTSGREALAYVLFEHQSTFDAVMPLRLLRYVVRVWERWLRDHPARSTLPIVLPVLLHHGVTGWQAAPELAAMLDASPELLEASRPFVPHFRFLLDDLATLSLDALSSRTLQALTRLVQLAFWSSRSFERLQDAAPLMQQVTATLSRDERTRALLEQLYVYLLRAAQPEVDVRDVRTILLEVAGPQGREDVMNAAEQLIEQGRLEGLERGRAEGLRAAIATALSARSMALSDVGRARLASCADVATLTRWLASAVTASSEAEVFARESAS
jgi:predicted transposase/invertase (TIGR01784 family)